jgi:EpsI family protein
MPDAPLQSIFRSKYARVLTGVLIVQAVLFYTASRGESAPPELPLNDFPRQLNDWTMVNQGVVEKEVLDILRADDTLSRTYSSSNGIANLFVAYFHTQRTGQSPHSPKNCLPGAGWSQTSSGYMDVPIPARNETIKINRYVVSKGEDKSLVLYWYQTPKRVIANEYEAKFWLVADSVRTHRSDTSLVRVVVPVTRDGEEKALATGTAFVKAMYPALRNYLPS